MKVGIVWNITGAKHPVGPRLVVNPRCSASLEDWKPCGRPATVRVTRPGAWSLFWCPVHVWPRGHTQEDWAEYWRLFPDALNRRFIEALPA